MVIGWNFMETNRNKYYLLNYVYLVCLLTLLLNDHYLKHEFSNWLTGKLSDVVGIIILPLLFAFTFPKLKRHSPWISAILFAFWKSPFSQTLIDLYNQIAFIQTSRTVDPTKAKSFVNRLRPGHTWFPTANLIEAN